MKYHFRLTEDAENDILNIHAYVSLNDSEDKADKLFDKLEAACLSLEQMPDRGHIPPELQQANMTQFLEIRMKPYRILYTIEGKYVYVVAVWDGRRDVQNLLETRLMR